MAEKAILRFYQGKEADMFTFYRMPKLLFTSECFDGISCEAKILYGMMLDRMSLSIKNGWMDELDRPYIYFSVEDVMKHLRCGKNKAIKCMKELEGESGTGLIEKHKQGVGKADIIYVKHFIIVDEETEAMIGAASGLKNKPVDMEEDDLYIAEQQSYTTEETVCEVEEDVENIGIIGHSGEKKALEGDKGESSEDMSSYALSGLKSKPDESAADTLRFKRQTSSSLKSKPRQVYFSNPNNTKYNNTKYNNTQSYLIMTEFNKPESEEDTMRKIDEMRSAIRKILSYDDLLRQYPYETGILDGICELLLEIQLNNSENITISGNIYSAEFVKDRFRMLRIEHIQYVMDSLLKNRSKIANIRNYLLSMLFNAPTTMDSYYRAEVNHDIAQGLI